MRLTTSVRRTLLHHTVTYPNYSCLVSCNTTTDFTERLQKINEANARHSRIDVIPAMVLAMPIKRFQLGSELANMVVNDAKMLAKVANLVTKNDVNVALPPRFRHVLIELPL
ncbi:hypothetical protein TNCV_3857141 [Trichonephila clavipes]|nr:hypothetical protein TNCV_3857141 [Trichonephila clavipes]